MKKLIFVLLLTILLSTAAFADYPDGWGVGVMGQHNFVWDGFGSVWGAAFSLKMPMLPIFWGVSAHILSGWFEITITGDYYFIHSSLVRPEGMDFGWYLGIGGYIGLWSASGTTGLGLGARVPVGLYFMPLEFLELFFDVVPSLGFGIAFGDAGGFNFPDGYLTIDLGIRFWF